MHLWHPVQLDPARLAEFEMICKTARKDALKFWMHQSKPKYISALKDKRLPPSMRDLCREIALQLQNEDGQQPGNAPAEQFPE